MTTNADLALWGEPPTTPEEESLATLLDEVMAGLEQGQVAKALLSKRDPAESREQGRRLIQAVSLLYECAASVWENSHRIDQAVVRGQAPTVDLPGNVPPRAAEPIQENVKAAPHEGGAPLLDPFPREFRIRRLLGEGSFGKVWLADDLNLGRPVALKTLKLPATCSHGPAALAGLRNEARHLVKLRHPNIVQVYAWRQTEGEYYLVLEYVGGGSFADRLKNEGPLDWHVAARYIADVGEGLLQVHEQGIIHRDIKPANTLWNAEKDEAMLTDFGVSALSAESGTMAGTVNYMAPEAFEGQVIPAVDVYSLAATLFHLITGTIPFGPAPISSLVDQILQGLPDPDPRCKEMPESLERLIRSGLAADAERRPKLKDFVSTLRSSLNQLLADSLVPDPALGHGPDPANIELIVSRQAEGGSYQQVAATRPKPGRLTRDMRKVPRVPEQVSLRSGDRVRIEVVTDRPGYLTVFNIGPTGNLNLLYPDDSAATWASIEANRPLHILDVQMTPPTGHERLLALWTRAPWTFSFDELRRLAECGGPGGSVPYRSTRDMKRIRDSIQQVPIEDWKTAILGLDHMP